MPVLEYPLMMRWVVGSIHHDGPSEILHVLAVPHELFNKGRGMCHPVWGIVHIKQPLLLIGKSNPCTIGSGFLLSLSEWSFTMRVTPYNRK